MKKITCGILLLCLCLTMASCKKDFNDDSNYIGEICLDSGTSGIYDIWPAENAEQYSKIRQNEFIPTELMDTQAFSLKVDTAAYTNIARYLADGRLPPADAVRTEELINYFSCEEEMPEPGEHPFSVLAQAAASPLGGGKYMAYIRVKTPEIDKSDLPPSNLTFLIDTSGSMSSYNKLPLLQQAFSLLAENLTENDTVSIVTYAGSAGVLLDSVPGNQTERIFTAISSLQAAGSTAGAQGIQTAYELAAKNYREGANNRVILATDGDFNVGISNVDDLKSFIAEKRGSGIYLSILGFGTGNLRDDIMETLAADGSGNYSYIDTLTTAQKVLIDEMGANFFVAANDVKAQLQFNKEAVKEYRLIGYENRKMTSAEFADENKDAGEIGAGTDIIVLAELILQDHYRGGELYRVCIRYKTAEQGEQREVNVSCGEIAGRPGSDFKFACAVAGFADLLRESDHAAGLTVQGLIEIANENTGADEKGYRRDFIKLLKTYDAVADR